MAKAQQTADLTGDAGQEEVQQKFDEINEKGYRGEAVDKTPNENYTVAGVTSGAPTPETEPGYSGEDGEEEDNEPEPELDLNRV